MSYETYYKPKGIYPTIDPDRVEQYAANLALIEAVRKHNKAQELFDSLDEIIQIRMEQPNFDVGDVLDAYYKNDADAMLIALVGCIEGIMAEAKIIPDEEERYYKKGDFSPCEITFPFYGKDSISLDEFKEYLSALGLQDYTWNLVQSMLRFIKTVSDDHEKWRESLWIVLGDKGVPKDVIWQIKF